MYRKFNIEEIQTSLLEKTIYIKATLDLDKETVTKSTIEVSEKDSKRIPQIDLDVSGQYIKVVFQEWPVPNAEYLLKIQKGIKSVVGDVLPASLRRQIVFTSEVTSLVNILYPANFEEVASPELEWEEAPGEDEELVGSYRVEIARETAFYNLVRKTHVHGQNQVVLKELPPGQYFARVRAEKDGDYGPWSDIITFVLVESDETKKALDPDEPVVIEPVELVEVPRDGETPESFVLHFNCDIDPEDIEITLSRREI